MMSDDRQDPNEVERLLRALAAEELDDSLPAPGDERLRAWRAGRLPLEEARELEGLLAQSAAGRRRLRELAGVGDVRDLAEIDQSLPLRRVRKAVLGQAGLRRTAPWRSAAVAAVAAAAVVLVMIGLLSRHRGLPEGLAYDVSTRGAAEMRSVEEGAGEVRAYPDTPVRIVLRPRGDGAAGVSFALFRRDGGRLRRVREPDEVRLVRERGSAAFSGTAATVLATGAPGRYPLFVVVSSRESFPAVVELRGGQDPADALRVSGRLVYPVTVVLLRDGSKNGEEGLR
jgi:hypothetical protein